MEKTVYLSPALDMAFPDVYAKITSTLTKHCIKWDVLFANMNIWCRDWMPIQTALGYTKFKYKTVGYDKYKQLHVPQACWEQFHPATSNIILDGGNVEQNETTVLMTEIVFKHNPDIKREKLIWRLEKLIARKQKKPWIISKERSHEQFMSSGCLFC